MTHMEILRNKNVAPRVFQETEADIYELEEGTTGFEKADHPVISAVLQGKIVSSLISIAGTSVIKFTDGSNAVFSNLLSVFNTKGLK